MLTIPSFFRQDWKRKFLSKNSQIPMPEKNPVTKRQYVIIFFLSTILFIGTIIKVGMDYHWWLPKTEILSCLKPEDINVKLDINEATWYELVLLPGLGETKAKAIVSYRDKHGCFKSLDELSRVDGIKSSTIEAIQELIKVESDTTGTNQK